MPKFSWSGRTSGGQTVSGNIDARSKDEVVAKLSANQIVVTNVTEVATSGEPQDPDRLVRRTQSVKEPPRAHPIRGLFIALGFLVVAMGIGALGPVVVYDCERAPTGGVNCMVHERIWGIIPIHEQTLANVASVAEEAREHKERDNKNREFTVTESRVVLASATGGKVAPFTFTPSSVLGTSSHDTYAAIDALVLGAQSGRVVKWQVQAFPLLFSAGVALLGCVLAAFSVLLFSRGFRERVQAWVTSVAARQKRRS